MSRGRHDYPGAIHLLSVQGRAGSEIFFPAEVLAEHPQDASRHAPDLRQWELLVATACCRRAAKVHGYAWLPNHALLLLQRFGVSMSSILPSMLGQYSRYLHKMGRVPARQSPYDCRCKSIMITRELLPYAVRHVYAQAVRAGLSPDPSTYPLCSHALHFAEDVPAWFETREFLMGAAKRGYVGKCKLRQFLAKPESPRHRQMLGQLSSRSPQTAGEIMDIEDVKRLVAITPVSPRIEQIVEGVGALLRKQSKTFDSVLTAALVTWYATRGGAATLKGMGRWFARTPTTLRADIESHRRRNAALFKLSVDQILRLSLVEPLTVDTSTEDSVSERAAARAPSLAETRAPNRRGVRAGGGAPDAINSPELDRRCVISTEDTACDAERSATDPRHAGRRPWKST